MTLSAVVESFVDAWYRLRTHEAVEKGYDRYLDRPPCFGPDDLDEFRAAVSRARHATEGIEAARASVAEGIDLAVLRAHLATADLAIERLGWPTSNPLFYVGPALEGLEALELRRDLPEDVRRAAVRRRLLGIAPLLAQAHAVGEPMDPYRDVVLEMLGDAIDHFGTRYRARLVGEELADAADAARSAMGAYVSELARRPARPFEPMGEEAYLTLLREEHLVDEPPERLVARARDVLAECEQALAGFEDPLGSDDDEPPADFRRADVLAYYRDEMAAVQRFVAENDLLTLPESEVELHETPDYLRTLLPGAFYLPPPAFSVSRRGHLFVSPVPRRMGRVQRRFYWARVRGRRLRTLIAHELWPGHHVQLVHAADHPRPIRKYRDDDVMVEGWGLYSESLVTEHGLFSDLPSPGPWRALRFRAARVIVDVGIHTGTMSLDDATAFMEKALGGTREWLRAEVRRYAAEPTQPLSYLVGREQILSLRDEWRERVGPARFSLRDFHDRFLSEGSIPVALIRRALLESP